MAMTRANARSHAQTKANRFRAGYSFTEVMFAVVVLGIGFIMIAAMFPVAISQQQSTQQESNAAELARSAFARIGGVAYTNMVGVTPAAVEDQNMPPTENPLAPDDRAPFVPFDKLETTAATDPERFHGRFHALSGDLILAGDRRYAFVPFYQREHDSNNATIIVVLTRVRARSTYDSTDVNAAGRPNLMPRPVKINVTNVLNGTDTIEIEDATGAFALAGGAQAVAEGSYVIVSRDPARGPDKPVGTYNGYIFRVGLQSREPDGTLTPNTWDLAPGSDYLPLPGNNGIYNNGLGDDWLVGNDALGYIVGRESDPDSPGAYRGDAQDIAVYTTFTQVR